MSQWQKVLLEIRMRHQECVDVQQLKLPLKVLEPEPSQSTIQALSNATRKRSRVQKRKGEILPEPEAVKRLTLADLRGVESAPLKVFLDNF